jgi:hypothetical protein
MRSVLLLLSLALLAACDRSRATEKTEALVSRALKGVLAFPQSTPVEVSAGEEAAQFVLTAPASVAEVRAWYRKVLPMNGWELKGDGQGRDGTVSMYAEHQGRPLWITLRPNVGAPGTTYTLIGAFTLSDSTKQADSVRR